MTRSQDAHTYRAVLGLVVDVHERSCDTRKCFELILQSLADVMRLPQGGFCVHDNVNFNEIIRSALHHEYKVSRSHSRVQISLIVTYVIRANGIELLDFRRKGRGLVDNKLEKIVRGSFTCQEAELLVARSAP